MATSWADMSDISQALIASSPSFPFLRLPPEIRCAIYKFVLPTSSRIAPPLSAPATTRSPYALARVSRLTRDEYPKLFYANVALVIEVKADEAATVVPAYYHWLRNIDESLMVRVKNLIVDTEVQAESVGRLGWGWDDLLEDWSSTTRTFEMARYHACYDPLAQSWKVGTRQNGRCRRDRVERPLDWDRYPLFAWGDMGEQKQGFMPNSGWNVSGHSTGVLTDDIGNRRLLEKRLVYGLVEVVCMLQFWRAGK